MIDWVKEIWGQFTRQHGDLAAGAVAIFGLLSLVPVMLLAVWIFVRFVARSPAEAWNMLQPHLQQLLGGSSSGGTQLLSTVHDLVITNRAAGLVGALGLAWSGSRMFNIITESLNEAWEIPVNRSFLKQNLVSLVMLVALGLTFAVSIGIAGLATFIMALAARHISVPHAGLIGLAISIALNVLTSVALLVVLYKWAPNRRVAGRAALFGGAIAGVLWVLFQQAFRFYLDHFASYNKIYGAMAGLVILILWSYYSAYIMLLGAVASAVYSRRVLGEKGPDETTEAGQKVKRLRGEEAARDAGAPAGQPQVFPATEPLYTAPLPRGPSDASDSDGLRDKPEDGASSPDRHIVRVPR